MYALDYRDSRIVVEGGWTNVRPLMRLEGMEYQGLDGGNGQVTLPASRFNFMSVEAIERPTGATDAYKEARAQIMSPQPHELHRVRRRIDNHKVLEAAQFLPHQIDFVAFGHTLTSVFNGSEQGTGKTRMTFALCEMTQGVRKFLIICPRPVMREWSREWRELGLDSMYPEAEIILLDTGSSRHKAAEIRRHFMNPCRSYFVVNYESVHALSDVLLSVQWDKIILDESWRIKNPKARTTETIQALSQASRSVLLLSGTPIGNTAADLYTQCQVMNVPELPDTYKRFAQRFCEAREIEINNHPVRVRTGVNNVSELMEFIDPVWYRATKESVLDLPPKTQETVYVDLDEESERVYHAFRVRDREAIEEMLGTDTLIGIATRAQQVTGGFLVTRDGIRELPSAKVNWIRDYVTAMAPGTRVIVWCRYNAEVHRITREVGSALGATRVAKVYGDTTLDELESIKLGFNSKQLDQPWVIVAQTKKLCAGHNLQGCDVNIFFSNTWSFIERSQAEDRSHRYGRSAGVTNYDLLARNTIDEEIRASLDAKEDMMQRLSVTTSWSRLFGESPLRDFQRLPEGDYTVTIGENGEIIETSTRRTVVSILGNIDLSSL